MSSVNPHPFILGLDLGTDSLGWAIVPLKNDSAAELARIGSRIFPSAMDGDFDSGKEESRNRVRREARLRRRQSWRRRRRLKKTLQLLQRFGMLPPGPSARPEERQALINELDASILASAWFQAKKASGIYLEPDHVLPYMLRAAALDEKLEPFPLGRAIFHLAQRRGFLSNRKQVRKPGKDDEGVVKEDIANLRNDMKQAGARTLGEFFAHLSPSGSRIRARWTARDMYRDEFEKICDAQAKYHHSLTPDRRKLLFQAIFYQRPLKFDENTIGNCELEPGEKRAPAYLLISQRFRLLDRVNNLLVLPPGEVERRLTPADRERLIDELEQKGDRTFDQVRKLLGLTKEYKFNLERGGEKRLPGNRTSSQFYAALGQSWLDMNHADRERIVEYVNSFEKNDKLEAAAQKKWNLDDISAKEFAQISLEPDYLNFSRKAMGRLLPLLEQGLPSATARKRVYPETFEARPPLDLLPPVSECVEIRNPAVMRSLSELRKVVNAIIRQYGKPAEIHIELARELKKPKKAREESSEKNRENEKARREAAARIVKEARNPKPSRDDIRKVLLANECGWHCPYTGRQISMRSLVSEPQFDFEHIIPFSRSLDDSFTNLTLCYHEENRNRKGNKTPYEAYAGDADSYAEVLARVAKFSGSGYLVAEKLRRFKMGPEELGALLGDFSARQLGDTAYASRVAAAYLGRLYGGVVDAQGRKRILTPSGQITAYLRNEWKLNGILNDGPSANGGTALKTREDHRHHAVDAVVIALANDGSVKMLSDAAQRAPAERRRRFASIQGPWPHFVDSVRAQIDKVIVSHRVSRKVSGALHKKTNYSPKQLDAENVRRYRVSLKSLRESDVMDGTTIADPGIARLVKEKFIALGGGAPEKTFALETNLPCFITKDGRRIPVKKVRIRRTLKTVALGQGDRVRTVKPKGNHHLELFGQPGPDGRDRKWEVPGVVTMLDAYERKSRKEAVVRRASEGPWEFRFSLAPGEMLTFDAGPLKGEVAVVRGISEEEKRGSIKIEMARTNDARRKSLIEKSGDWIAKSPNELRKWGARKVALSPLGEMTYAND